MAKRKPSGKIHVSAPQQADVYLSGSWREDRSGEIPKELVRRLGKESIFCVGDVKVGGNQDSNRIKRIVNETSGLAVVLPFRSEVDWFTSEFIWEEVSIAASQNIPVLFLVDKRVSVDVLSDTTDNDYVGIRIADQDKLQSIRVKKNDLIGPLKFDEKEFGKESLTKEMFKHISSFDQQLGRFVELTTNRSSFRSRPFVFLSTRLKDDFLLARKAIASALDESLGVVCLWADSPKFSTEVEGIYDRAKYLIKESQFVVVDLTFGPESPEYDSPSRAHEVGMAQAFEKEILATAQQPRREPYFSASMLQLKFWNDEEDLRAQVIEWAIAPERQKAFGRRIYSYEVSDGGYEALQFDFDSHKSYIAPNANPLTTLERTVVAVGFAMIALAISLLVKDLLKFDDTFDFAAIVAAVFTLVFASDINQVIRLHLGRWTPLRWMIPSAGIMLLTVWAALRFAA